MPGAMTPHPIDIHVGSRLRARRVQLGVSQTDLADALNVTFQQIQKYERGTNRISASKLFEATQFLKISPGALYDGLVDPNALDAVLPSWPEGKAEQRIAHALPHLSSTLRNRFADLICLVAQGCNDNDAT